ncbi:MAG: hypothetical protein PHY12_00765 [Eubacteriales bacterium]|nr:hypothetical protein [Eubacteriales bacterium]
MKLRSSNRCKVLLCYALCFGIAALWPCAALRYLYPLKLAGTAPQLAAFAARWFPVASGGSLAQRMEAAGRAWRLCVGACLLPAWLGTLLCQLTWRACFGHPAQAEKAARRAMRGYRLLMLCLLLWNALCGALIWVCGARTISGFGLWDALIYFGALPLNLLAALLCFRLAAPPAISGRHAFFKRL